MPSRPRIGLTTTSPQSDKFANYRRAVEKAGGEVVALDPKKIAAADALRGLDALILTGGGDVDPALYHQQRVDEVKVADIDARRDEFEIALVRATRSSDLPILGICRGVQVMNVALDGELIQHVPAEVGDEVRHTDDEPHPVDVDASSKLARILGATRITPASSHHQALSETKLGAGLRVVARAPDGIIEAVEDPSHPWRIGVQWHPERSKVELDRQQRLFDDLVRAAQARKASSAPSGAPSGAAPGVPRAASS